jgi:hypothetical protein
MKIKRWKDFSPMNTSQNEAKFGYVKLNIPRYARHGALSRSTQKRGLASVF